MNKICFIGTGGSVATEDRDNTAIVLQVQDSLVLIDCPGSVVQKLRKAHFDPREIETLLVTHIHPDHIYGLPSFIHSMMQVEHRIKIYGSEQSMKFCAELLDLFGLREKKIKCRVDLIPVDEIKSIRLGVSLTCEFSEVPHCPSSRALHFFWEAGDIKILYSGDTPIHEPLFRQAKDIDYLIHDCSVPSRFFEKFPALSSMHTDALTLGQRAQEAGVKHLIPCHFFGELGFVLEEIEEEIRKNFRGKLTIPQDYSIISLSGKKK
jgi:ribonuclease Z